MQALINQIYEKLLKSEDLGHILEGKGGAHVISLAHPKANFVIN